MLRIPRPYRERITADMRLHPSASAQILATLGLRMSAKCYTQFASCFIRSWPDDGKEEPRAINLHDERTQAPCSVA
jgi:hypothetical protein